jgi:putative ABC transport system permease protein
MVFWKVTLRELKSRPGRSVLTLLSVMLAVAAVVAVNVSSATTRRAYQEMYASLAGRAALEVVAEGGGTYGEGILPALEKVAGVKAAVPLFIQPTTMIVRDKGLRSFVLVMGVDPSRDEAVRDYGLEAGSFFGNDTGALMEAGFARGLGLEVNDEVKLVTWRLRTPVKIQGLLSPRGAAGFNSGGVVFLPLRMAQGLFRKPGEINAASLVLDDTADESTVKAEIARQLPQGLAVRSPLTRAQLGAEAIRDLDHGLTFAYTLTLMLAAIVILNTFLMNVGERRRMLSILRAVGTTRRQIMAMLLREGLLVGIFGTVLGSLLGLAGAYVLSKGMAGAGETTVSGLVITPWPFVLAAILGPGTALAAMLAPAFLAGSVTPLEGMRPVVAPPGSRVPRGFTLAGLGICLVLAMLLAGCMLGYLPGSLAIPLGVALTASGVLLIPAVLGPASRFFAAALGPVFGIEGRLAVRQILRRRTRTTLTIGVLYISVASGIGLGTAILNDLQDVKDWQSRTFVGDFFVRPFQPDVSTAKPVLMPESIRDRFGGVAGIDSLEAMRIVDDVTAEGLPVIVFLREFPAKDYLPLDLKAGSVDEVRRRLSRGEVVISTVLAHRTGKTAGDQITLETRQGPKNLRIAGTSNDFLGGGMMLHMDRAAGMKLLAAEGLSAVIIKARPEALAGLESTVKQICGEEGLMLHSFTELRRQLDDLLNQVVVGLWGIMGLGLVVSAFAVANTLTMNVLEQTREIAMLRIVAMSRGQVRKTILSQAAILGLVGVTLGVLGGVVAAVVTNACSPAVLGRPISLRFHTGLLVGTFAIALITILLTAWLPARRATRMNLLAALQQE